MIKLVMSRHYQEFEFEFNTIHEAVKSAISDLDHDNAFPFYIEKDGIRIWEESGPFNIRNSLKSLLT